MANDSTFHGMHLDAPKSLGGIGTSKLTADPCLLQPSSKGSLVVWMWYSPSDLSEHSWYSFSWRVFFFRAGTNAVIQPWAGLTCILCLLLPDQTWWRAHALLRLRWKGKQRRCLQTQLPKPHWCWSEVITMAVKLPKIEMQLMSLFFLPKEGKMMHWWLVCIYIYIQHCFHAWLPRSCCCWRVENQAMYFFSWLTVYKHTNTSLRMK